MKQNFLLCLGICSPALWIMAILLCLSSHSSSQEVIKLIPSQERKTVFNNFFSQYAVGTLDKAQVATLLRSTNHFDSLILEANGISYSFSLEANDVRTGNYVLRAQNGSTIEQMPRGPNKTWTGKTLEGGLPVCITVDEQFFTAMITTPEGPLFIESAKLSDPEANEDLFVIYHERNVTRHAENSTCGVVSEPTDALPQDDTTANRSMMACMEVEIAIANDKLMFQKYGSVGSVEVQNLAVINLVNTVYDNEFSNEIRHKVVEILVVTGTDPWNPSTDSDILLDGFTDWAPDGFLNPHDIGSLWSNRDFDDSTIGLAWVDVMCTINAYNILQDFSPVMAKLRTLQAHELGHNYGYYHDNSSGFIMSSTVSTTETWSVPSITTLNTKFAEDGACHGTCQPTSGGRVGIGTTTPHSTAMLDITSSDKGFLMPRLTPVQRNAITTPADGLTVYDTHTKSFWFYNGNEWVELIDGTDFPKQATHMSFGQAGNVGIGLTLPPANKLDIATSLRGNLEAGVHPTNLPVYITGNSPLFKGLEVRSTQADYGVGLEAGNFRGGVYSIGWISNVPLSLSSKGLGELQFRTNNVERARITGNGNFAIGTTTPNANALLDITSTSKGILIPRMTTVEREAISNPVAGLLVFDNTTNSFWYRGSSAWVELSDNLDQEVYRSGPDKIYMGLTDSVGIGTNDPKYKLDVKTSVNQYGFAQTSGAVELASWIGDGAEIGTVSNHTMRLYAGNGLHQFALLPNGNIGIGLQNPANRFDISHGDPRSGGHATGRPFYVTGNLGDASNGVEFRHADNTQGIGIGKNTLYAVGSWADQNIGLQAKGLGNVLLHTGGAERFRFTPSGQLGIGVIDVHGTIHMSNALINRKLILYEGGNNDHQYYGLGINPNIMRYQVDALASAHVFYAATSSTTSNELMRIRGNGNVVVSGTVEVETMITPALLNSFTQYGNGYANAGFYKDKMGRVFVRGTVNNVNNPSGLVIFNLPAGYRPTSGRLIYNVNANGATGRVDIMPNGDVLVMIGTAGWVNLDGVSFKAD